MSKLGIFMADGCEEIEGLTVVDIARRSDIEVVMISITDKREVVGAHNIVFHADALATEVNYEELDGVILPGGMPGTLNLGADATVDKVIKEFAEAGKLVGAICAAPSVLGQAGLLAGKCATSYPGFEEKLLGANVCKDEVVVDGNIITSRGMGTAIPFALAIVSYLTDEKVAGKLSKSIIYQA